MTRSLHILLATIEYPPQPFSSGIGSYTKAVAEGLAARGHRVRVLTRGTERNAVDTIEGVTVEYVVPTRAELPKDQSNTFAMAALGLRGLAGEIRYRRRLANRIHDLVARHGYDLVEAADHLGEAAWYDPARHPGVPFVVRLHTPMTYSERVERNVPGWVTAVVATQERRQARHATHLSSPSATMVAPFLDALHARGRHVHVFPNPNLSTLGAAAPTPDPAGPPVVLFVGRLTGWKGVDTLMRAVPHVLRRHPDTRFQLLGGDTGPCHGYASYRAYLESLLPDSVRHSVEFLGKVQQDELASFYRRATVCVFPSRFDVLPYTCLEAMNYGKAIIGSSTSGMRDMLDDGAAGLLHHPPDVDDLTENIVSLLDDPGLRVRLGSRAFDRARSVLSVGAALDATEEFYLRAIDDLRARPMSPARTARPAAQAGARLASGDRT